MAQPKEGEHEVAKNLTPAQREVLAEECFEMSLEGLSLREIGRRKGLGHPTVSSLVSEEAQRRRKEHVDHRTRSLGMKYKALERLWQEWHGTPSPHASAQVGMAVRGFLQDIDAITGIKAPTNVNHRITFSNIWDALWREMAPKLTTNELAMLYWLVSKYHDSAPAEIDLVEVACERLARNGKLDAHDPVTENFSPKELEVADDAL